MHIQSFADKHLRVDRATPKTNTRRGGRGSFYLLLKGKYFKENIMEVVQEEVTAVVAVEEAAASLDEVEVVGYVVVSTKAVVEEMVAKIVKGVDLAMKTNMMVGFWI